MAHERLFLGSIERLDAAGVPVEMTSASSFSHAVSSCSKSLSNSVSYGSWKRVRSGLALDGWLRGERVLRGDGDGVAGVPGELEPREPVGVGGGVMNGNESSSGRCWLRIGDWTGIGGKTMVGSLARRINGVANLNAFFGGECECEVVRCDSIEVREDEGRRRGLPLVLLVPSEYWDEGALRALPSFGVALSSSRVECASRSFAYKSHGGVIRPC